MSLEYRATVVDHRKQQITMETTMLQIVTVGTKQIGDYTINLMLEQTSDIESFSISKTVIFVFIVRFWSYFTCRRQSL